MIHFWLGPFYFFLAGAVILWVGPLYFLGGTALPLLLGGLRNLVVRPQLSLGVSLSLSLSLFRSPVFFLICCPCPMPCRRQPSVWGTGWEVRFCYLFTGRCQACRRTEMLPMHMTECPSRWNSMTRTLASCSQSSIDTWGS